MVEPGRPSQQTKEAVAEDLARQASDRPVQVVVGLQEDVSSNEAAIKSLAKELLEVARRKVSVDAPAPTIGKAFPLARAFSLTADPRVVQALVADPHVKSLTVDAIADIYPKPIPSENPSDDW